MAGHSVYLWSRPLADEFDIRIEIHQLPPGTSKWNKIGYRLLSFITQNTRAKPSPGYRATSIDRPDNRMNRLERLMQSRHQLSQGGSQAEWRASTSDAPFPTANGITQLLIQLNFTKRLFPDGREASAKRVKSLNRRCCRETAAISS